ncbi:MAG TPA: DUF11 domain-containing protein [Acidimicrobiia bacterium]|nr:DUF11 domain-containing protein [Acidimicrobiia bacterium]
MAVLLSVAPHAMAEGRFRLPYGDGLDTPAGSPGPAGPIDVGGRDPHAYSTPPPLGSSGRFGPGLGGPPDGRVSADLQLAATSAPDPATQGNHFDYTLTVTNAGPAPTTDVNLDDQLPNGVRLVQSSATQGVCSAYQQYVRCALGSLDGGRAATVTITVNAVQSGSVYNTASVMGREYDPSEGNNTVTVVTDVQPGGTWAADLSVTNAVDHATANPGDSVTYTVTAANAGPAVAVGTHLDHQLPDGADFLSATPSQGSCSPSSNDIVCELGDLASGAAATVTVTVRLHQPGTAVSVAYVTSQMLDNDTGDNQAQATTAVGGQSGPAGPPLGPTSSPAPPRSSRSGSGASGPGPASPVGPARPATDSTVF